MEHIVVDSSVLVAALVDSEGFHARGKLYLDGLETGDYTFHLPMLAAVEVIASVSRRSQRNRQVIIRVWSQNLIDWEQEGSLVLYPLDGDRMERAVAIAQRHRLRGADSVIAALAEELEMPLKTFDNEILSRFLPASV